MGAVGKRRKAREARGEGCPRPLLTPKSGGHGRLLPSGAFFCTLKGWRQGRVPPEFTGPAGKFGEEI